MATPTVITVTAKFKKLDDTPESGRVTFQMQGTLKNSGANEEITPGKFSGMLTSEGVLSLPVYATDDPAWSPVDRTYKVIISLSEYRETFDLYIPYDSLNATLDLADVGPAIPPSAGVMYALVGHTHPEYEGGGGGPGAVTSVNGKTGTVVINKTDVGLSAVDNTADSAKPVSTAQQTALNLKANSANPTFTGTVSGVTKAHVGLGNADNTADVSKPVSTAQQIALDLKADAVATTTALGLKANTSDVNTALASKADASAVTSALATKADLSGGKIPTSQIPAVALVEYLGSVANQSAMLALVGQPGDWANRTDTGTSWQITGADPTQLSNWTQMLYPASPVQSVAGKTGVVTLAKADVGLGSVDNTADSAKPVSTAQQTALNLKAPLASPAFTGTPTGITKTHVGLGNVDNTADANKSFAASQISDSTSTGRAVLTAADGAAARSAIGAGTSSLALGTSSTTAAQGDAPAAAISTHVAASDPHTQYARVLTSTGSGYSVSTTAEIYIGPDDPGTMPAGSIWIDTDA